MTMVQLHLALNHFPIVGLILSAALLIYGLLRGRREARNIALVGIAVSGLLVLPVRLVGHEAAEVVEHLPGFSETLVERHEEAADLAGTLTVVTGIAALLVLGLQRWAQGLVRSGTLVLLVMVMASTAGIGWAGHLGGLIRHPELNPAAGTPLEAQAKSWLDARNQPAAERSKGGRGHDDDD